MTPEPKTIDDELKAALHHCAVIDRSLTGRVEIGGKDALDLLHRLSTNDLLGCKPGSIIDTVFTTDKGRIVDYVRLAVPGSNIIAVTSPSRAVPFIEWVTKYCIMEEVHLSDVSSLTAMVSAIGPQAASVISQIYGTDLPTASCVEVGRPNDTLLIIRDRTFGLDIIDIIGKPQIIEMAKDLLESRATRMSSESYEVLRIAHGLPSFGAELSNSFNPYDVGLRHAISFTKGCYLGQEVIARIDTYHKVQRKLMGLVFNDNPSAAGIQPALFKGEREVGRMTSFSSHPVGERYLGLGIVKIDEVEPGDSLWIDAQGARSPAVAQRIPIVLDLKHEA